MKQAALFPGQGSQVVGMGKAFVDSSELARQLFKKADDVLDYPLTKLCMEGPLEELTLTQNAQPAILVASYVCFAHFDGEVVATAGHSLGEYTALVAAGVLSFEDAVSLVRKRGQFMQEAVPNGQGAMLAVMGPSETEIGEAIRQVTAGVVEIANLNSPGQTVVAGDVQGTAEFTRLIKSTGAKVISLNVSAPFHCSLMKPASDRLAKELDRVTFATPRIPVYANVTAEMITSAEQARCLLEKQVCSSVRWTDSMLNLVEQQKIDRVIEFGAGGVLSKLMKRIKKEVATLEIAAPADLAMLAR